MHIVPAIDPAFDTPAPLIPLPAIRRVVPLATGGVTAGNVHDRASRRVLPTRIANLLGLVIGDAERVAPPIDDTLFVPADAIERPVADRAGITRGDQILGGVVPAAFIATKAITYGLRIPTTRSSRCGRS